jgi:hypothetical protein
VRNNDSSDDDYKEDPFLDHPGGAALWLRLRGEPGKIVADWAVGCFQPSLRQLEPHENGEVYDADGGESVSEVGHCSDPAVYSADDDDSNHSCGHTCTLGPECTNCFTSSGGSEPEELDMVPMVRLGPLTTPEPKPEPGPGGTMPASNAQSEPVGTVPAAYTEPLLSLLRKRRDRLAARADRRIKVLEEWPEPDWENKVRRLRAFRLSLESDRPEDWP